MTAETTINETTTIRFARNSEKEIEINEFIHDFPKDFSNRTAFAKELLKIGYEAYLKGIQSSKTMENRNLSEVGSGNIESVQPLLDVIQNLQIELAEVKLSLAKNTQQDTDSLKLLTDIKGMLEQGIVTTPSPIDTQETNINNNVETENNKVEVEEKPNEPIISEEEQSSALEMMNSFGVFDS
ncbi:hypothetical protein ABD87_14780 [Lysinibacillus sphaericus]|uniref:hypothetical protein n=1 Tax=Lysinibacillus sphaericus TaxID=1421 RepID=UPI0018CFDC47|nr:hypothetical protein [Lysinibacillus sphaericus]MBG9730763.1 hypothetical protein [Lysinibacillus sphaericus]